MLEYTGHPLVDVGIATITAIAGKTKPSELTEVDLTTAAEYMKENYVVDPLKSFLNVAFPNSGFTNPAFEKLPGRRSEYADRVLFSFRGAMVSTIGKCVFTGLPAIGVAFSDKLPPGRAYRQHIPLVTGEGVINFYPWGEAGTKVSGLAMLAIQAMPLGSAKCGGKLLAVHSDDPEITLRFAEKFCFENQRAIMVAQQAGSKKLKEANASAKTLLISTFLEIEIERQQRLDELRPASVTAYHLTNSGQSNPLDRNNPPLDIYHLPLELTDFLCQIVGPEYKGEWSAVTDRAWRLTRARKMGERPDATNTDDNRARHNFLYEDLFRLPANAPTFVRRYFLRIPIRRSFDDDPRRSYSLKSEADLVSWKLTSLFLLKVMRMNKERVEQIKNLGDRLADYVCAENDRRFFTTFFAERKYHLFRTALVRANLNHVKRGNPPLFTLDPYIAVFEDGDEVAAPQWSLARDLVLIRLIERLHQNGWLGANSEVITQVESDEESE